MRMEQYLTNTDYALWQIIMNGDEPVQTTKDDNGVETEVPPKTAQAILARQKERKAKSILLLAIPDEYQLRFHAIKDAKSLWAAIKSSLLEVHGAAVSNEDANQFFLKALPSSWNNIALIMRNKEGIDDLDIDDLYNNLKVFEADIKGSCGSSLNSHNVAFLSAEDTNSINEVNTANGVSTAAGHNSPTIQNVDFPRQSSSSSYADDLIFSFFANQSNSPQLDDEDLEQIDHDDLGEMDLKCREPVRFDKTKVECFNCHRRGHFARECRAPRNQGNKNGDAGYRNKDNYRRTILVESSDALVVQDNAFQLSTKDKTGLGYGDQLSESDSEVPTSVFDSSSSDGDDNQTNDRFKKDGYHDVPPPLTGNYMPPLADLSFTGLDDSVYRPTANKTSASTSQGDVGVTQTSNIYVEKPEVESVRTNRVIIEDWVSDDEDIFHSVESQTTGKVNTVWVKRVNTTEQTAVSTVKGRRVTAVKASAGCVWRPNKTDLNNVSKDNSGSWISKRGNPQQALKYKEMFDSGCSRHMTGNKPLLSDYQEIDGGFVAFGGSTRGGKITVIGKIRTNNIDFEDVFFVKELKFNLFSVSQLCDKKNSVLFTETECLVLSPDFKLPDENQVLLRVPRQNNMYSFDLKNVVPSGDLTCLFAKATTDESNLWHRRLGNVNFKTMNKLVKGNLVRGLPSKTFENDHTCVACLKGKQHKASCKVKLVSSISQQLQMLHMDLFGLTSVRSINHKTYCPSM
ncbi:ribonuclease H-like domain-containing protein [Tanacetum coccineum]